MESSMELSFGSYSHSSEGQQRKNNNSKLNVIQKSPNKKKFIQKAKKLQLEVKT